MVDGNGTKAFLKELVCSMPVSPLFSLFAARSQNIAGRQKQSPNVNAETVSQTDWITSYRFHPAISSVACILNIIDTPGFGDVGGIERDQKLVEQIRAFFTNGGIKGIEKIDVICFVIQGPLARLTPTQKYIFHAILSIFGKDMADNIVFMITFADGKEPPVLNVLNEAEVPHKKHFVFNNSALFEPNTEGECSRFGKMFWELGCQSFVDFFTYISTLETQSLQMTANILEKRKQLKATIDGLMPQIKAGLQNLASMKEERDLLEKFEREIRDNQNFTYMIDEIRIEKMDLDPGSYVTNCLICNATCHYPCAIPKDEDKHGCAAMDNGVCMICPNHCHWSKHVNNPFRIEATPVTVKKTYEEMKKKYEMATQKKVSKEEVIESIKKKFVKLKNDICNKLELVRIYGNYLRQNAIQSNPLTELEYLDLLIDAQENEKTHGFQKRIKMLQMLKKQAELAENAVTMDIDSLLKHMGFDDV